MHNCDKCCGADISTKYIKQGKLITSSSRVKIEDEFTSSSEYDFYFKLTAKKDHLHLHCMNCGYEWNENAADGV